jgi:hypothetical protein
MPSLGLCRAPVVVAQGQASHCGSSCSCASTSVSRFVVGGLMRRRAGSGGVRVRASSSRRVCVVAIGISFFGVAGLGSGVEFGVLSEEEEAAEGV